MDVVVEAIRRTCRSLDHLRLRKADAADPPQPDRKAPSPTTLSARVGGLKMAGKDRPLRRKQAVINNM
ncbi:hypothetical protein JCM10296v2_006309 [Rhodotorula toruloides]